MTRNALVLLYASLAVAQHTPVGEPVGNPISRPMAEIVPACKPFTITWQATTSNTISFVLLRGPASNILPVSTIGTGIPNTGLYAWTPGAALETNTTDYSLQLIDDVTGQFQVSTQFGLSRGPECKGAEVVSSSKSPSVSATPVASSSASSTSSQPTTPPPSSGPRLGPGAIAGISVGAIFAVTSIVTAIFLAYRLGQRRRTVQHDNNDDTSVIVDVKYTKSELDSQQLSELAAGHGPEYLLDGHMINELPGPVAELPGETMKKQG